MSFLFPAAKYELRVCYNTSQDWATCQNIDDSMLIEDTTLSSPKPAGEQDRVVISYNALEVPAQDTAHYAMIKAVDAYGNAGKASNPARLQGPVSRDLNQVAIILGIIGCVAVLGTAIVGAVMIRRAKSRQKIGSVESGKPEKSTKSSKPTNAAASSTKAAKSNKPEPSTKPAKSAKPETTTKPAKSNKPAKSTKPTKSGKTGKNKVSV